jgi:RecB family exonuclease
VRNAGALCYREEPFVITIARPEGALYLRGTIDLLVAFPDGSAEVVDYKSTWHAQNGDPTFALSTYALAAHRVLGLAPIRVGVLDLGSPEPTVSFAPFDGTALSMFEEQLAMLRGSFLAARTADHFPGVERSRCERLRCGFLAACHERHAAQAATSNA